MFMAIPMPSTSEERERLFSWVIERLLSRMWGGKTVEEQILLAIDDPDSNPEQVAARIVGLQGFVAPGEPYVETHTKPRHATVWTRPAGDVIMRISMKEIVEYVRRKHSPQLSLFSEEGRA